MVGSFEGKKFFYCGVAKPSINFNYPLVFIVLSKLKEDHMKILEGMSVSILHKFNATTVNIRDLVAKYLKMFK